MIYNSGIIDFLMCIIMKIVSLFGSDCNNNSDSCNIQCSDLSVISAGLSAVDNSEQSKVLVIDDDQIILHEISLILNNMGFNAVTADSGSSGLNFLLRHNKNDISLIILDIMMSDMYGLDTLKAIKENAKWSSVPVYIYSSMNNADEIDYAMRLGASGYITKASSTLRIRDILQKFVTQY